MTTDFRALCAKLVQAITDDSAGCWTREFDVLTKARAALAELEPPADGEVEAVLEATPAEPFSDLSGLITVSGQTGYPRIDSSSPTAYRWGRRNGALVLQVGYPWAQGAERGVDWEDVPTVDLDKDSQP